MISSEIPDEISQLIDRAFDDVSQCRGGSWGLHNLPQELLTIWAVVQAQGIIDNGGFQYFFEQNWDGLPLYSVFVEAFRRIGATEAADCLDDAVQMFPSAEPHMDCGMRNAFMDGLRKRDGVEKSVIDLLGRRVIELGGDSFLRLADYIRSHGEFFPSAAMPSNGQDGA